mgnify:FL=1
MVETNHSPMSAPRYDPNRLKKQVLIPVFISVLTIVFIFSFSSFRGISLDLSSFRFYPLGISLVLVMCAWLIDSFRLFLTVRAWGKKIRFFHAFQAMLSNYFLSSITPFSTGGSPAQAYVLARRGLSWGEALSLVTVCGILYQVGLLTLLFVFIFVFHIGLHLEGLLLSLLYSFAIFYSVVLSLLFFFLYHPALFYRLTDWGISWVKRRFKRARFSEEAVKEWVEEFFTDFQRGFAILFLRKPQYLIWNIICYMLNYLFIFSIAYFVLLALGVMPSYFQVVGAQIPLYYIFSLVPSPGASGGVEITLASVFLRFSGAQRLGLFILLWRVITYYLPMLLGGILFFQVLGEGNGGSRSLKERGGELEKSRA